MNGVNRTTLTPHNSHRSWGGLRTEFGFKAGVSGAHTARTMMLTDLSVLLEAAPEGAGREQFNDLIIEQNILGKRTTSNRRLTAGHLCDLYALECSATVFRLLRLFWSADPSTRPMLALLASQARDSLLRASSPMVLKAKPGESLTSQNFAEFFHGELPGRFSPKTTLSLAQNVGATWTQAGFFKGKINKVRTRPHITAATAAYALALGYLCGLHGQLLIESAWAQLLDVSRDQVIRLAQEASKRGWLDFKGAGNIFEINFRQILTPKEIQASHGPN